MIRAGTMSRMEVDKECGGREEVQNLEKRQAEKYF